MPRPRYKRNRHQEAVREYRVRMRVLDRTRRLQSRLKDSDRQKAPRFGVYAENKALTMTAPCAEKIQKQMLRRVRRDS